MAIEHALQVITPISLLLYRSKSITNSRWIGFVLIASAMTFLGHGLYAMGFHPVPLSFQVMTMKLLFASQETALLFLSVVGWLDILVAVTVFIPKLRTVSLLYLVAWGGLTALARIASHVGLEQPYFGFDPWLAETLVRTPHWLLPLLTLFLWKRLREGRGETGTPASTA